MNGSSDIGCFSISFNAFFRRKLSCYTVNTIKDWASVRDKRKIHNGTFCYIFHLDLKCLLFQSKYCEYYFLARSYLLIRRIAFLITESLKTLGLGRNSRYKFTCATSKCLIFEPYALRKISSMTSWSCTCYLSRISKFEMIYDLYTSVFMLLLSLLEI